MNEFNERRGQSPFYAIMAIMTLVVAAVGATFAWFTLQTSNNSITGNIAKVGLSMSVTPLSTDATGDLIPLGTADNPNTQDVVEPNLLPYAVVGDSATGNKSCVDKNGNTVCKIYQITLTNEGTTDITVDGNITFEFGEETLIKNLKWQKMTSATVPSSDKFAAYGTTEDPADTAYTTGDTLTAGATKDDYYLLIWLDDVFTTQNDQDYGTFTGTVEFTGSDGAGITGTFTVEASGE